MKHKVNLEWYAFRYDVNSKKLEVFNVIRDDLISDIEKAYKKKELNNFYILRDIIKRWGMYHYWGKCEYEIVANDLFSNSINQGFKIDVWYQLEMNLDRLTEYVNKEMRLGL